MVTFPAEQVTKTHPTLDYLPASSPIYVCANCGAHLALQVRNEARETFAKRLHSDR